MKRLILTTLIFLIAITATFSQENTDIFTIYLVRHAEKGVSESDPGNPPLSQCGELRAENLALILNEIHIYRIYSTNYIRTIETAKPISESKSIEIENYDPRKLKEFSLLLLSLKEDALIVGHSNTTSVLAGMLAGEEMIPFDETIYDRIYQVHIFNNTAKISILNQGFNCEN